MFRSRVWGFVGRLSLSIVLVELLFVMIIIYYLMLNWIGPSTEYFNPHLPTAVMIDGEAVVYLGDDFYVGHRIKRHKLNGNCLLKITRYGEDVDGPTPGRRHQLDYAELNFVGQNETLSPRWPPVEDPYKLGYERATTIEYRGADNHPIFVDHVLQDEPLLPDGIDQLHMDFYVVSRYFCNFLDYMIPRYIQGGIHPDESPRVRGLVKRYKP